MKILIAPDSFKHSMSAVRVCEVIRQAIIDLCPEAEIEMLPIADGGEGTIEAMRLALEGLNEAKRPAREGEKTQKDNQLKQYHLQVNGSLSSLEENATYLAWGDTAIIEMAQANGLEKLADRQGVHPDPLQASTYGTGEMIMDAVNQGYRHIVIGIGGSATNDGGTGALQALGVRFYDRAGREIERMCGGELINIEEIDASGMPQAVRDCRFTVMCDVDNPLTGPDGATYVYGPQKGADKEMLKKLEEGMFIYRKKLLQMADVAGQSATPDSPGAGAAGGLGAALMMFLNAKPVPGIEAVLDYGRFDEKVKGADLVITGEGKTDEQTLHGKAVAGVCRRAKCAGVPILLIAGSIELEQEQLTYMGITYAVSLMREGIKLNYAIAHARELLYERAKEAASSVSAIKK